jgi:hypothetical protein
MEGGWILPVGGMYPQPQEDARPRLLLLTACTIPPEVPLEDGAAPLAI